MQFRLLQRWTIAAVGMLLAAASDPGRLANAEEPAQGQTPRELAVLDRIFANWKARSERVLSLHFTWDCRTTYRKGTWDPSSSSWTRLERDQDFDQVGVQFWLDGNDRMCVFDKLMFEPAPGKVINPNRTVGRYLIVGDTMTQLAFQPGIESSAPAWRAAQAQTFRVGLSAPEAALQPTLLTFRPQHPPLAWQRDQCRLITENAVVEEGHYIKIQRIVERRRAAPRESSRDEEACYVDPVRDDVVVHWTVRTPYYTDRGSIKYQKDKTYGWIPSEWKSEIVGGTARVYKVTNYAINEKIDPATFAQAYPAGTLVADSTDANAPQSTRCFVVQQDGSKKEITMQEYFRLRNLNCPPIRTTPPPMKKRR